MHILMNSKNFRMKLNSISEIGLDEDDLYGMNSFNNGYIADHYRYVAEK